MEEEAIGDILSERTKGPSCETKPPRRARQFGGEKR